MGNKQAGAYGPLRKMEGGRSKKPDFKTAVEWLEKAKVHDAEAMWMLGVFCEFGMGTAQDVGRAVELYRLAAEQGNKQAALMMDKLKNKNGRGCTKMDLSCEHPQTNRQIQTSMTS